MKIRIDRKLLLDVPNIRAMMDSHETSVRAALLQKIIDVKRPIFPDEIEEKDNKSIIDSLSEKGLVVSRVDGAITGIYPVSGLPTHHKVLFGDGRSFFAMCAIDSLGATYEFNQDVSISSSCGKCNLPIGLEISNGVISLANPSTTHALHVDIGKYKDWASTC